VIVSRTWSLKSFFQVKLRTILVLVTLVGIVFGVAEVTNMRYTRQRRIQAELQKARATVVTETVDIKWLVDLFGKERLQKVIHVTLNENVTDVHLQLMHQLPDLQRYNVGTLPRNKQDTFQDGIFRDATYLNLTACDVSDAGMVWVGKCKKLETLFLTDTKVTDKGLKRLAELSKLRVLWLDDSKVTLEGVRELRRKLPAAYIHFGP
jgi:hypothetical protein